MAKPIGEPSYFPFSLFASYFHSLFCSLISLVERVLFYVIGRGKKNAYFLDMFMDTCTLQTGHGNCNERQV